VRPHAALAQFTGHSAFILATVSAVSISNPTMKLPLYWIDAFTDKIFHGNPAAVVPLTEWLPDETMQRIAFENGISETAFFVPAPSTEATNRFHLRWFTPEVEVDLCGHATLATAFALFNELGLTGDVVTFDSRSGPLTVTRRGKLLALDFPSRPATTHEAPADLVRGLKLKPEFLARTHNSWLCVYADAKIVGELQPDFLALKLVQPGRFIVTAPGASGDCDFVSRFFAPDAGVPEDPVTGSSHSVLIPYWAQRLGKNQLHARQISARGGELFCEFRGERVGIGGHAALYLRGEIRV
jgi:PhzF family phenazine biosynthesis protein